MSRRIKLIRDIPVSGEHVLLSGMVMTPCGGGPDVWGARGERVRLKSYEYKVLDYEEPEREWFVFSTALSQSWLMLYCDKTGARGTVRDPSKEEWNAAFSAPSNPYRWTEADRVCVDPEAV
jgi:hypothetical protein